MSSKNIQEWFVDALWGKIAMVSWGNPENPPVFLMHGHLDTAATFTFLVDKLPDDYYYVAIDIPGHGKSDPFPPGIHINTLHIVEAMRVAVEYMKWKSFIFVSHSMGCLIGLCYNAFFPGQIEKSIFLDPTPALAWYYVIDKYTDNWFKRIYCQYYDNYNNWNFGKPQTRTYESWIKGVSRTRRLTEEQCKVILSRVLIPTENNKYKLSWEPRARVVDPFYLPMDLLYSIVTSNQSPTLVVHATEYTDYIKVAGSKEYAESLMNGCEKALLNFHQVTAKGFHDFHITNPEHIAKYMEDFLKVKSTQKSKL